jgi:Na+-driven multidrug efflux pump
MPKISFLHLAGLVFVQRALVIASMTTDTFFLSKVSDEAVSGVGLATTLMLSLIATLNVIAMSGTSLLSFSYGTGNKREADGIFRVMMWVSAAAALVLMCVQLAVGPHIGGWVGLSPAAAAACSTYLIYMAPLFLLDAVFNSLSALLTASKRVRELTIASGTVLFTNLLLNASILFEMIPGVHLGVREVALASVLSQVPAVLIMGWCASQEDGVPLHSLFRGHPEGPAQAKKILGIALPTSLDPVSLHLSGLAILTMLGAQHTLALAAFAYIKGFLLLFTSIGAGAVGVAAQVFVGYRHGVGDYLGADRYVNRSLALYVPIVFAAGGLLLLFSYPVVGVLTDDARVLGFVSHMLAYMIFSETLRAITMIIYPALRGLGEVRRVTALSVASQWAGVAAAYLLSGSLKLGLDGVMIAVLLDEAFRAGLNYRFWKQRTAGLLARQRAGASLDGAGAAKA